MKSLPIEYTNPVDAIDAFYEGLPRKGSVYIEEFLAKCSPEIRSEIRPLLETAALLVQSSYEKRGDFIDLLSPSKPLEKIKKAKPLPIRKRCDIEAMEDALTLRLGIIDEYGSNRSRIIDNYEL